MRKMEVEGLRVELYRGSRSAFSCTASYASAFSRVREFLRGRESVRQTDRTRPGTGMRVAQKMTTSEDGRMQAHNSRTNGSPKSRKLVPIAGGDRAGGCA